MGFGQNLNTMVKGRLWTLPNQGQPIFSEKVYSKLKNKFTVFNLNYLMYFLHIFLALDYCVWLAHMYKSIIAFYNSY